jgi:hypothetical protein
MSTRLEGPAAALDAAEIRSALAFLIAPGATTEIRALPAGRSWIGRDMDAALAAITPLAGQDLYYLLNPCRPDLIGAAKNADIIGRRWVLIDCDSRHGDRPSDATERGAAWRVSEAVRDDLAGRGWPEPAVIDSGNGIQLLYRCELDNSPMVGQWIAGLLRNLSARHSDDHANVDIAVHNAGRLARLPGTFNRKGEPDPESGRVHRLARVLSRPETFACVPADLLRDAASAPPKPSPPRPRIKLNVPTDTRAVAWFRAALSGESRKVATAPAGSRHNTLRAAARTLAGYLNHGHLTADEIDAALAHSAAVAGLDGREIRDVIAWAIGDGAANPLPWPECLGNPPGFAGACPTPADGSIPEDAPEDAPTGFRGHSGADYPFPLVIRGSDVTPRKVDWLMPGRIPLGFLTLMAGRTGVGKSFVTLDLAARLSAGEEIPGEAGECFVAANTLVIGEDSHEYVLAPRLIEAGADMGRIAFMGWEAMASYSLADSRMLDDAYHASGRPKLVVIDPPTNFLGAKDEHKNAEVRQVLMHVSIWAMSHDVAVVMITHCNKGSKKDLAALDRIIGSVAWASTARIAHLLAPHPEEEGQSVFLPLKSNIGPLCRGLSYVIVSTPTLARVEWGALTDVLADDALGGREKKPRGIVAVEWLADRFRERREWPSDELHRAAAEAGISRNALFSPEAQALPIRRKRHVNAGGESHWTWAALPEWPAPREG